LRGFCVSDVRAGIDGGEYAGCFRGRDGDETGPDLHRAKAAKAGWARQWRKVMKNTPFDCVDSF
jgi:hypothetical protein